MKRILFALAVVAALLATSAFAATPTATRTNTPTATATFTSTPTATPTPPANIWITSVNRANPTATPCDHYVVTITINGVTRTRTFLRQDLLDDWNNASASEKEDMVWEMTIRLLQIRLKNGDTLTGQIR